MKMDNLSGICYKMTDFEYSGSDLLESNSNRSGNGSTTGGRRKMSRWDQNDSPNRSKGSLLTTMEHFVQTVDDMNETILVPCRLMDAKFDSPPEPHTQDPKTRILTNLNGVDLFQFYTILNNVKNDLMWGSKTHHVNATSTGNGVLNAPPSVCSSNFNVSVCTQSSGSATSIGSSTGGSGDAKGHKRRPSTVSIASSASVSDTEFSELNEDSGLEVEEEYSQHMSDTFHHHLNGLQQCLRDLTVAANYVTTKYNNDLGGAN